MEADSKTAVKVLNITGGVLLRCFIAGMIIMLISFALMLIFRDLGYQIHAKLFDITKHEFVLTGYCWLGLFKIGITLFFLIPWIGVKLMERKLRKHFVPATAE